MPILLFDRQARTLGPGVLTIGSAPEAGWRIEDRELAPIHALVTLERDGRALLSRAGGARILVNGEELWEPSKVLAVGDAITLGDATLRLEMSARHAGSAETGYLRDFRRGRAYQVGERVTIGRDVTCQVHLTDPDVSRLHAEIVQVGGETVLRPRDGIVFRNGDHLTGDMALQEGDELSIGRSVLRFTRETPASAAVVPAPAAEQRRTAAVAGGRRSQAQTSFMGVVQMREHLARDQRKKVGRVVQVVAIAAAVLLGGLVLFRGAPAMNLVPQKSSVTKPASTR